MEITKKGVQVKRSRGGLFVLLLVIGFVNCAMSYCNNDFSVPTENGFYSRILHLTGSSVRIQWFIPEIVEKISPDYYCIVYNSKTGNDIEVVDESKSIMSESHTEFEIGNLTEYIFYEIYVKPCVRGNCSFMKSQKLRFHT